MPDAHGRACSSSTTTSCSSRVCAPSSATTVEVVGAASEVDAAIELIRERVPDVVLVDVHMPDGGGARVIRDVLTTHPGVRFLALSVSDAPVDVIATIRAGARGYVTKTIAPAELRDAIARVADGDAVFSPRLAGFVLDAFAGVRTARRRSGPRPPHRAGARGPAAHRTRVHVQGDRAGARDLGEDGRDPRLVGAAQAAALDPPPARALGHRPPPRLSRRPRPRCSSSLSRGRVDVADAVRCMTLHPLVPSGVPFGTVNVGPGPRFFL